jgi:hypothetical protein
VLRFLPYRLHLSLLSVIVLFFLLPFPQASTQPSIRYLTKERAIYKAYSAYPKVLVFIADLNFLGKGKLLSLDTKTARIDGEFKAISGIGGIESQSGRGPIPSVNRVNLRHSSVNVKPLYLSLKGIEGNFYKINPHLVNVDGKTRGDFGIHFDANVPGTAGCLGISNPKEWLQFQKLMTSYQRSGLKTIPLIVAYY